MNKVKQFFANKRNLSITIAISIILVLIAIISIILKTNKLPANDVIPVIQSSSEESSSQTSSKIVVPPIIADKTSSTSTSSVASVPTSSKSPDIVVDGDVSSKQPTSSKATSKPASSKPKEKEPVSSAPPAEPLPPPVEAPVDPPHNPDGPQHGDTIVDEDGTWYYHAGYVRSDGSIGSFRPEGFWDTWGNYPQFKGNWQNSEHTAFLKEGDNQITPITKERLYWCNCNVNPRHNECWKNEEIYSREHPGTIK